MTLQAPGRSLVPLTSRAGTYPVAYDVQPPDNWDALVIRADGGVATLTAGMEELTIRPADIAYVHKMDLFGTPSLLVYTQDGKRHAIELDRDGRPVRFGSARLGTEPALPPTPIPPLPLVNAMLTRMVIASANTPLDSTAQEAITVSLAQPTAVQLGTTGKSILISDPQVLQGGARYSCHFGAIVAERRLLTERFDRCIVRLATYSWDSEGLLEASGSVTAVLWDTQGLSFATVAGSFHYRRRVP